MEAAINTAPMPQPESQRRDNFFRRFVDVVLERIHLKARADQEYALGGKNPAEQANSVSPQEAVTVNNSELVQKDNSTTINQKGLGY